MKIRGISDQKLPPKRAACFRKRFVFLPREFGELVIQGRAQNFRNQPLDSSTRTQIHCGADFQALAGGFPSKIVHGGTTDDFLRKGLERVLCRGNRQ